MLYLARLTSYVQVIPACEGVTQTTFAAADGYPDIDTVMGSPQTLNAAISGNDTTTKIEFKLVAQTTGPVDTSSTTAAAEQEARDTGGASRRNLQNEDNDDPNYYGCFSRVRNSNGALVGQLTGSCARLSLPSGTSLAGSAKLCIPKIPTRKVHTGYSVGTLVVENDGGYKVDNQITNIVDDGANVCANVPAGVTVCSAAIAPTAFSASTDIGTGDCPFMRKAALTIATASMFAAPMEDSITLAPSGSGTFTAVTTSAPLALDGEGVQVKISSRIGMQMALPPGATGETLIGRTNGPIRIFRRGFPQHLHTICTSVVP